MIVAGSKTCSIVQCGLAPFVKDELIVKDQLITDVQKTPYSFKFDETTNSPVKKQYDGYVSFFSKKLRKKKDVTTHYVIKYCQTRWLSLDKVLVRNVEQYENLKEYFLKHCLRFRDLKGKMESIKLNVTKG